MKKETIKEISKKNRLKYKVSANILEAHAEAAKTRAVLEILSNTVANTLGPYGTSTIIQGRNGDHVISKDGFDLMSRIVMDGNFESVVIETVRKISSAQVQKVGDGTTSSIIVANALCEMLMSEKNIKLLKCLSPKDVSDILERLSAVLTEMIQESARPVTLDPVDKNINRIARVSVNNDTNAGDFIANIYRDIGKYGFITTDVMDCHSAKDEVEKKTGVEIHRGYITRAFGEGVPSKKIDFTNSKVFISAEDLTESDSRILIGILEQTLPKKEHLLIIAPSYDDYITQFLETNRRNNQKTTGEIAFTAVDVSLATQHEINLLRDIATLAGCTIYKDNATLTTATWLSKVDEMIGTVERVIVTENKTNIIGCLPANQKAVAERAAIIKKEIDDAEAEAERQGYTEYDCYLLKTRLSNLTTGSAVVHIGGRTYEERKSRERLIEDAILSCRSALNSGYIVGGNLTIPRILLNPISRKKILGIISEEFEHIPNYEDRIEKILVLVGKAFLKSYTQVLYNTKYLTNKDIKKIITRCITEKVIYDVRNHRYDNDDSTLIINPSNTDIQIMNSTISIISMLALSNQALLMSLVLD